MTTGVALVTTAWVRDCARGSRHVDVLNAFLLYHIHIGIDRIFVFLDGDTAQQPTPEVMCDKVHELIRQERIALFYRDAAQRACYSLTGETLYYVSCRVYEKLQSTVDNDVASRQMVHAELAMARCRSINQQGTNSLKWLLHLDIDELLLCRDSPLAASPETPLKKLVTTLEKAQVNQLTVVNYEGVSTTLYGDNYFTTTTTFRRHTAHVPFSPASQKALEAWQRRSPYNQFFLFYDNGKSMVRIPPHAAHESPMPSSVHHWRPAAGTIQSGWRSVSNFYDPRRDRHRDQPDLPQVCVLHYPVCGLEWLTEKYERLGPFAGVWGGTTIQIPPCFHLQARDASRLGSVAMRALYETQVMVGEDDTAFWKQQRDAGVCEEIRYPAEVLKSLGFEKQPTITENSGVEDASVPATAQPLGANTSAAASFTVAKAWMLAAISDQYL